MSPGRRNAGRYTVTLYVGEGPRGSNGAPSTLLEISATPSATHNQTRPLWCWFPSGWTCAHSRPLWVSPTTSPVRLGVSTAAVPNPMGALFHPPLLAGALGYAVCFATRPSSQFICVGVWGCGVPAALPAPFSATLSPALLAYLHECGAAGSASAWIAYPVCPTLRQSWSRHSHASPLHPRARLCPSYRSG